MCIMVPVAAGRGRCPGGPRSVALLGAGGAMGGGMVILCLWCCGFIKSVRYRLYR